MGSRHLGCRCCNVCKRLLESVKEGRNIGDNREIGVKALALLWERLIWALGNGGGKNLGDHLTRGLNSCFVLPCF